MNWRRSPLAMENRVEIDEINVSRGSGEAGSDHRGQRDRELHRQSAAIVTGAAQRGDQNEWHHDVETTHQPNPKRIIRIEKIICAADQMTIENQFCGDVRE